MVNVLCGEEPWILCQALQLKHTCMLLFTPALSWDWAFHKRIPQLRSNAVRGKFCIDRSSRVCVMLRDLGIIISVWSLNMSADHLRMIFFLFVIIYNTLYVHIFFEISQYHNSDFSEFISVLAVFLGIARYKCRIARYKLRIVRYKLTHNSEKKSYNCKIWTQNCEIKMYNYLLTHVKRI